MSTKRKPAQPKTAKQMLAYIEAWAKKFPERFDANAEPAKLWTVLTALRGPDLRSDDFSGLKSETTEVIRGWLVPELALRGGASMCMRDYNEDQLQQIRLAYGAMANELEPLKFSRWHFEYHMRDCVSTIKGLGLKEVIPEDEL